MKAIFMALPFAFFALLMLVFVVPAKIRVRAQAIWAMALLLCASKFVGFDAFGGDAFAPELPEALIWVWGWAYSGMCLLLALAILLLPVKWLAMRLRPASAPAVKAAWLVALPLAAWTLSAVGVWNGVKAPEVKTVELEFANLPPDLDGYRLLQISDIHASSAARRWRTEAIVAAANAADADLVCLTGDYADGFSRRRRRDIAPIAGLRARDGVLAVTGNHEYYYDIEGWLALYDSLGIRFLDNACAFPRPGLAVAGVPDPVCTRFGFPRPDPDAALAPATNGEFRVLLQHRPLVNYSILYGCDAPRERIDFQPSGHTHGGVAPGMDRIVAAFNGGFVRGLYRDSGLFDALYVSPGAGQWAGFPVRFFNDPEITLFVLRRAKAD